MDELLQDLRYAARALVKNPGFTAVAALTLALGIGANTAIFSVVNGVLLKPLPYRDPERLERVFLENPENRFPLSVADWELFSAEQRSFESLAAYFPSQMTLTGYGLPQRLRVTRVTADYFDTLGVAPVLGRTFRAGEDRAGSGRAVVVSDRFWREHLGAEREALGRVLTLDEVPYTLIGVLPAGFQPLGPPETDLWAAMALEAPGRRGPFFARVVARRRAGVSDAELDAELDGLGRRVYEKWAASFSDQNAHYVVQPLAEAVVRDAGTTLLVLFGAVAFLLAIATANVANLLLVRSNARQREMAVRAALGATRARLARQLLTESVLLAVLGGAGGLLLAVWGLDLLLALIPGGLPRAAEVGLQGRVFLFTAAVTVLSGLVFGMAPIVHSLGARLSERLHGERSAGTRKDRRLRNALVVAELALALPLLVGAGLLLRSLEELLRVDAGVAAPEHVLSVSLSLPEARYPRFSAAVVDFYTGLLERARALPGVEAAGLATSRPPRGFPDSSNFAIEGRPVPPGQSEPVAVTVVVDTGYFKALGIPVVLGRGFDETDGGNAPPVIVIDQTLAQRFFPDEDPIGQGFHIGGCAQCPWSRVIGVVGRVKYDGLDVERPTIYTTYAQQPYSFTNLFLRTPARPLSLLPEVREMVGELDAEVAVASPWTLEDLISDAVAEPRYRTLLLGLFAALAVSLALVGVHGVLSYLVSQSRREIGIRMALGAEAERVRRMILSQGMRLAAMGVVLGLVATFGLVRYLESLLYAISATDPGILALVTAALLAAAAGASYLPARRATRIDPMVVLREE